MKKLFAFICVAALAVCAGNKVQAQIFDLDAATDFYLIWLDEGTEAYYELTPRIVKDYRPNGDYVQNVGERFIDIWSNTFTFGETPGKGSLDQIGNYLNAVSTGAAGWAGGGFQLVQLAGTTLSYDIDFTGITDDFRFHIAVKSSYEKTNRINLFGGGKFDTDGVTLVADDDKRAQFLVGKGNTIYGGDTHENLTPDFKTNEWTIVDIPVSRLKELGWNNRSPFRGYYFSFELGATANDLAFDAAFYYRPIASGILNPKTDNKLNVFVTNQIVEVLNATAPIEVYNLAGIQVKTSKNPVFGVDELNKGAYIIKSGSAVAKVIIK